MRPRVLVLDAMGVLYPHPDDVLELLVPYLRAAGSELPVATIEKLYQECSLGRMTSARFWAESGATKPVADEDYTARHTLTDGTLDVLERAAAAEIGTAVLSNDISEWSRLLRRRHGLDRLIPTWVISGDVGLRKPDPKIYGVLLDRLGIPAGDAVFVDDRANNLAAAARAGLVPVAFMAADQEPLPSPPAAAVVRSMPELAELLAC